MRMGPAGMRIAVTCCATILLLAACDSSSSKLSGPAPTATSSPVAARTNATTGNFDSCSVVSRDEAASVIGAAVTPGVMGSATVEGGLACVFYGPAAPTPRNPNVAQADSVRVVLVKGSQ